MHKFLITFCFFWSTIVYASPELIPTVYDHRRLETFERPLGGSQALTGVINAWQSGDEVFDVSLVNATGTARQTSYIHQATPNSGPVFWYGSGSASSNPLELVGTYAYSHYRGSFESTETFNATLSGVLRSGAFPVEPAVATVWIELYENNPLVGSLIWRYETGYEFNNEETFRYSGTFEANTQYYLQITAGASGYADDSSAYTQSSDWEFTFELDVPEVAIDVLPEDSGNKVYPNKSGKLPVAVLSSAEFNATQVNPATLRFGSAEAQIAEAVTIENVDGEFGDDTVAQFKVEESGIFCNDTEVELRGTTYAGDHFIGVDVIDATECETGGCHAY